MDNKYLIGMGVAAVVILASVAFFITNNDGGTTETNVENIESDSYHQTNLQLHNILEEGDIFMSSPIILDKPSTLEQYCSFFEDQKLQNLVEYCTSTELKDSDGKFLGNIHLVGSKNMPKIILVLVQTNPFMNNIEDIKTIFNSVIETQVCDCWEQVKPSGIESVDDWIEQHREFHTSDVKPHSRSNLVLEQKQLEIELTTNQEGYLWKLLVSQ